MKTPIRMCEVDTFGATMLKDWLSQHFEIEFLPEKHYMEADYLLCGDFGFRHERFPGVKIFITIENHEPDLNNYDYTLTHAQAEDDRRHRLPWWQHEPLFNPETRALACHQPPPITIEELQQRDFCNFVCRNAACHKRNQFISRLNKKRRVHCAGPLMNNTGFILAPGSEAKRAYQNRHLFSIVYENEATRGYQTEKLIDALMARSIPVYWGNPDVEQEFNPDSFIHARHFPNDNTLINHLLQLANDPERMAAILNSPRYRNPHVLEDAEAALLQWFTQIFERGPECIRRTRWQRTNAVLSRYYGHGLFRSLRRLSRHLRHKR